MKNNNQIERFVPRKVTYDPSLDAYNNVVLFPKKLAEATAFIEKHGLPEDLFPVKKQRKKSVSVELTGLQKELLDFYTLEPTEAQMLELKTFLAQLFSENKPLVLTETELELEKAA